MNLANLEESYYIAKIFATKNFAMKKVLQGASRFCLSGLRAD